ncbi:MAG: threonylcarbamoyl-AMP synthase [Bacteroidales bacterium]|nr:threonylcarbamoyl-AMP synthase [Bacteroidales bacterium]
MKHKNIEESDNRGDVSAASPLDKPVFYDDIKKAVEIMRAGGIILYPTDTVWGVGCDATNEKAVQRIFELKRRADSKSMIVLVDSEAALERTVDNVPEVAWQLIEAAVDPLTIVYDRGSGVAPSLLAADGSLGVRITRERFSQELCRRLRRPVVSTSANLSGSPAPRSFAEIGSDILDGVDYVVMSRRNAPPAARPSGIIKVSEGGVIKIIR